MKTAVRNLFARYQRCFNRALDGDVDLDEGTSFCASAFIAASPAGRADDQLGPFMEQGYERYRATGTKEMRLRDVRLSPMDQHHCVAHVAWRAAYSRQDAPDIPIDFDGHYFVQKLNGEPTIFGWVAGDEQALLKKSGIICRRPCPRAGRSSRWGFRSVGEPQARSRRWSQLR